MNPNNYPEVKCYECGKLATRLVWRSRCLTCVVKRIEWLENFECEKQARIYELEAENKRILDHAVELSTTVPKGYAVVPVEPTEAIKRALYKNKGFPEESVYEEILRAAQEVE